MTVNKYTDIYLLLFLLIPCYCQSFLTNHPGVTLQSSRRRISFIGTKEETSDIILNGRMKKEKTRKKGLSSSSSLVDEDTYWPSLTNKKEEEEEEDDDEDDDDEDEEESTQSAVFDSILKVHCTHSEPDFLIPWQRQHQSTSTSSGFVIDIGDEKRIMTNAHSVDYGSIIQVQRRGQSTKYQATIEALSNECDLAVLNVKDEEFWDGLESLEFGSLPKLQEEVEVLGYPTGGDSLSVTSGVVSRIEIQEYTQASTYLLAMQIDAAINSGNSGGPVVNEDMEIVGVAFEALEGAENIGYVVPVTVVQHFLEDIRRHGTYTGFCSLGVTLNMLENLSHRKSLGMISSSDDKKTTSMSGVQINSVEPTSLANSVLQKNDVILEIDGIVLGNDGKIPFRRGERVAMACYLQTKYRGDFVSMKILRNRKILNDVQVPVSIGKKRVKSHYSNRPPPYMVVAGLVFTPLSVPYLYASNAWDEYISEKISYLLTEMEKPLDPKKDEEVVLLAQVLAHPKNLGYDKFGDMHLIKCNDVRIRSLKHLQEVLQGLAAEEDPENEFITFEFTPGGQCIVLERSTLKQVTKDVCAEHFISNDCVLLDHYDNKDDHNEVKAKEAEVITNADSSNNSSDTKEVAINGKS